MDLSSTTESEMTAEVRINFSTCAEFLGQNLTLADLDLAGTSGVATDTCGNPLINMTYVMLHPSKYAITIVYPICLLICTVGNILTLLIINGEPKRSVKRIYLIGLWSQFFPYLTNYDSVRATPSLQLFITRISGGCTFLQEMLITSSDWILLAFSIERFFAVVFPLHYTIFVSKRRSVAVVVFIFILAALYSLYNLFDYYWLYYNDDPRCPAVLIRPPQYINDWHLVQEWAVLIIPVVTFLVILGVNLIVTLQLLKQRRFRILYVTSVTEEVANENQAIQILLACALVYILTQCPVFVYNVLRLVQHYPFCNFVFTDDFVAKYSHAIGVTININYSINFLLYYGVSFAFRQGLRNLYNRTAKAISKRNWFGYGRDYLRRLSNSSENLDERRWSVDTVLTLSTVLNNSNKDKETEYQR